MVAWLVIVPVVLLLLAFAGANWKAFHLAYCRQRIRSKEISDRFGGAMGLVEHHLRSGMSEETVLARFDPLQWTDTGDSWRCWSVDVSQLSEGKRAGTISVFVEFSSGKLVTHGYLYSPIGERWVPDGLPRAPGEQKP